LPRGNFHVAYCTTRDRGGRSHIYSDSDCTPVPKILNPDPKYFQIWESDSCSNSGNRRCNRNSTMFALKQWHL